MKPLPGAHTEWVDDEAVVLNPTTGELHYLNPSAAVAWALVLEYGMAEAISRLNALEGSEPEEVEAVVSQMAEVGLLIDD